MYRRPATTDVLMYEVINFVVPTFMRLETITKIIRMRSICLPLQGSMILPVVCIALQENRLYGARGSRNDHRTHGTFGCIHKNMLLQFD